MSPHWEKRILHLGLGRFHRAHQAAYFQRLHDQGDSRWGVISFSMRSTDVRDQMLAIDLKYPLIELSAELERVTWIESIREVHGASEELDEVLKAFSDPKIEIISLTVTEKGYSLDAQGKFNLQSEEILRDLKNPKNPKTAVGILSLGLQTRKHNHLSGLTVVCCDNLRDNGHKLRDAVYGYLKSLGAHDDLLWIKSNVKFPNTMVDRIVPALTIERTTELEKKLNIRNSGLIATEEFSQWIIEDNFQGARPPWDKVGVEFVKNVLPFEEMKLKLLNASHSYLAYEGQNRGYKFVHEAIQDSVLRESVLAFYGEVIPLLEAPQGYDLAAYCNRLITRFKNDKLPHQLKQIAMDGSLKLTQRVLPSLAKSPTPHLLQVMASWLDYIWSFKEEFEDPMKAEIKALMTGSKQDWTENMLRSKMFSELNSQTVSAILQKVRP